LATQGAALDQLLALTTLATPNGETTMDPNTTGSAAFAGWPIERIVPALAAGVTGTGLILGELHTPQWRLLSAFAAANLALYAAVGWCPASALLTKAGVPSIRRPRNG